MLFIVIAKDAPGALEKRQQVRDEHLRGIESYVKTKKILFGGAILDDDEKMVGSSLLVDFESRDALDAFLHNDIYTRSGVWQDFEIYPFKRAV